MCWSPWALRRSRTRRMGKRRVRVTASGRLSMRRLSVAARARTWRSPSVKGPFREDEESKMAFNLTEIASQQVQGAAASASGIAVIAEHLRRSSVQIGDGRGKGGSGVIWETSESRSVIITNAHVVKGQHAGVTLHDGQVVKGRLTSLDDRRDLAALTIEAGSLSVATIGDSDALRVGELVFAVGNPLGFVGALAVGVVHAIGKQWIGADVRLAPGNSGGMLANA